MEDPRRAGTPERGRGVGPWSAEHVKDQQVKDDSNAGEIVEWGRASRREWHRSTRSRRAAHPSVKPPKNGGVRTRHLGTIQKGGKGGIKKAPGRGGHMRLLRGAGWCYGIADLFDISFVFILKIPRAAPTQPGAGELK